MIAKSLAVADENRPHLPLRLLRRSCLENRRRSKTILRLIDRNALPQRPQNISSTRSLRQPLLYSHKTASMVGQTISHYEVLERIGGGGMGEVFKARDTLLNRFVAVKVLYADAGSDTVMRARMLNEARSASALNHPNIVTLYDVIRQENSDILVMEYVPGRTLAGLIAAGPLRLKQVIEIALQVAAGLGAAHRAGLMHRDLKPANILLTAEGVAKIADFGLAKRLSADDSTPNLAVTATIALTEAGQVVGTPAYMSPEQIEGKAIDAKTDIFSFGVVLYEMLSGKTPFARSTLSATLNAVVHEDLPLDGFPRSLARLLDACLQKEAYRRLDTISSARLFLEMARDDATTTSSGAIPALSGPRLRWKPLAIGAGFALLAASAGFLTARFTARAPDQWTPRRLTHLGTVRDPALSPDGKLLVFSSDHAERGNPDIWLQQVDDGATVRLTSEKAVDDHPVFSADGTTVYFHSTRAPAGIYAISVLGGEARPFLPNVTTIQPSPDGKWLAWVAAGTPLKSWLRPVSGGAAREIGASVKGLQVTGWSPDSGTIGLAQGKGAFYSWNVASGTLMDTGLDRELRRLDFAQPRYLSWLRDGRFLFIALHEPTFRLWSVRMPPGSVARNLHPEPMTLSNETDLVADPLGDRVLIGSGAEQYALWTIPGEIDKGIQRGPPQLLIRANESALYSSVDRAQKTLAFTMDTGRHDQVFLQDLATGRRHLVAPSDRYQYDTLISPSGKQVAFRGDAADTEAFVASSAGGEARSIGHIAGRLQNWTPDERYILFTSALTGVVEGGILDPATGKKELVLSETGVSISWLKSSPNGKWLSFVATRSGRSFIGIAPFRGMERIPQQQWTLTETPNYRVSHVFWAPGGRVLYYARSAREGSLDDALWVTDFNPDTGSFVGVPRPFYQFTGDLRFFQTGANTPAALDDRIIFSANESRSDVWLLEPPSQK